MNILITGCAGFIGFHTCMKFMKAGHWVAGIDNLNDYYDVSLKKARLNVLKKKQQFKFNLVDFKNPMGVINVIKREKIEKVIHLGAQAGVRYSIIEPHAYVNDNISGFLNILEACVSNKIEHVVYASSSSVYGTHTETPQKETLPCNTPMSMYAVTKKTNEMMAHSYSDMFGLKTTGLRFFTVYGPWGRPDMALFLFTKNIIEGEPIILNNNGDMKRDWTYIDDIVEGIYRVTFQEHLAVNRALWSRERALKAKFQVFNIGGGRQMNLITLVKYIEEKVGKRAIVKYQPMQMGDVKETFCDTSELEFVIGYKPSVKLKTGVNRFVDWYLKYYGKGEE